MQWGSLVLFMGLFGLLLVCFCVNCFRTWSGARRDKRKARRVYKAAHRKDNDTIPMPKVKRHSMARASHGSFDPFGDPRYSGSVSKETVLLLFKSLMEGSARLITTPDGRVCVVSDHTLPGYDPPKMYDLEEDKPPHTQFLRKVGCEKSSDLDDEDGENLDVEHSLLGTPRSLKPSTTFDRAREALARTLSTVSSSVLSSRSRQDSPNRTSGSPHPSFTSSSRHVSPRAHRNPVFDQDLPLYQAYPEEKHSFLHDANTECDEKHSDSPSSAASYSLDQTHTQDYPYSRREIAHTFPGRSRSSHKDVTDLEMHLRAHLNKTPPRRSSYHVSRDFMDHNHSPAATDIFPCPNPQPETLRYEVLDPDLNSTGSEAGMRSDFTYHGTYHGGNEAV